MIFYAEATMIRRILLCVVCLVLALAPVGAWAGDLFVMAGYDGEGSQHDWAANQFFTRMQERTGISFTFQQHTKRAEWEQAKAAMFSSGPLPDVLFKAALSTDELIRYTESGQLIDLKPLLAENAPNLWALLQQNPGWLKAITLPSGKIGALPSIQEVAPQNAMWINQQWLDQLHLDMPTDLASLREVLTAFRDRDPNGNGKQDEVPFAFLGPWELKLFSHAFGVVANDYNIYLDDAGVVHYWPLEDSFINLARELRSLYADGLLDPDGFATVDALRRISDDKASIRYGAMFSTTPVNLLPFEAAMNYVVIPPFACEGRQIYRDLFGPITRGAFAITSACEDPAALLKWVDILYTEEGAIEAMVGVEGTDYAVDSATGGWDWIGGMANMTLEKLNQLSIYDSGDMPWLFPQDFYSRHEDADVRRLNAEMAMLNQHVVQPFPPYALTSDQSQIVAQLQSQLGPWVDECLARFVLGETDINDETIAAFHQGLVERGVEDMTAFWQEIAQQP